jgi:hypothetical protein
MVYADVVKLASPGGQAGILTNALTPAPAGLHSNTSGRRSNTHLFENIAWESKEKFPRLLQKAVQKGDKKKQCRRSAEGTDTFQGSCRRDRHFSRLVQKGQTLFKASGNERIKQKISTMPGR